MMFMYIIYSIIKFFTIKSHKIKYNWQILNLIVPKTDLKLNSYWDNINNKQHMVLAYQKKEEANKISYYSIKSSPMDTLWDFK